MSQENVELVCRLYEEAYARRTVPTDLRERVADDFRFHMSPEFPGRSIYSRDEMPQIWADLDETYSGYSLTPTHFAELGEYVLVTLQTSARMREGQGRIETTLFHLWRVQDAKGSEAWTYRTHEEALEAAGLRD